MSLRITQHISRSNRVLLNMNPVLTLYCISVTACMATNMSVSMDLYLVIPGHRGLPPIVHNKLGCIAPYELADRCERHVEGQEHVIAQYLEEFFGSRTMRIVVGAR